MSEVLLLDEDVVALIHLLAMRPEPPTREGIRSVLERAQEETTVLGRRIRHVWLKAEQLDWLRGALDDYLRTDHASASDRETFSRILTRLWADDLLARNAPKDPFFEYARMYSTDADMIDRAKAFLAFKLEAAAHAREEILMILNRGVTTYQVPTDPRTGQPSGLIRETQSFVELFRLRLWLDLLLFELVGVEDALLQAANVAFNLGHAPTNTQLRKKIHAALRRELDLTLKMPRPACEITGLEAWVDPSRHGAGRLEALRELRRQATHRHLVNMRENKPWTGGALPAPVEPAKLRSEFYVDLGNGREESLHDFVGLSVEHIAQLVSATCRRFATILQLLTEYHGGPIAAARRRAWQRSAVPGGCAHETVEPRLDKDGVSLDPYFCSQCGLRVEDPAGKRSPDGSTYF